MQTLLINQFLLLVYIILYLHPITPRVVRTKYGDVSGVITTADNRYLDAVEVFRGIPYASAPIGNLRFMPPVSPEQWKDVKLAHKFGPVCPQNFAAGGAGGAPGEKGASQPRLEMLRPYLKNESEDCLYLNVYTPISKEKQEMDDRPPVSINDTTLKQRLDKQSIKLLGKMIYTKIFVQHNVKTYTFERFTYLNEGRYYDFIEFLVKYFSSMDEQYLQRARLVVGIQKAWRGFRDRQRIKALQEKVMIFHCVFIRKDQTNKIEENSDTMKEEQKNYLEIYRNMYLIVNNFIKRNKKFKWTRRIILKYLKSWNRRHKYVNLFPFFIQDHHLKKYLVKIGVRKYKRVTESIVRWNNSLSEFIRLDIRSFLYNADIMKLYQLEKVGEQKRYSLREKKNMNPLTKNMNLRILRKKLRSRKLSPNEKTKKRKTKKKPNKKIKASEKSRARKLKKTRRFLRRYKKKMRPRIKKMKKKNKKLHRKLARRARRKEFKNSWRRKVVLHEISELLSKVIGEVFQDRCNKKPAESIADLTKKPIISEGTPIKKKPLKTPPSKIESAKFETIPDIPVGVVIKRMIRNKIIVNYTKTKFDQFYGTLGFGNESTILDRETDSEEPVYTSLWAVQAVKEFCVFPMYSEKIHQTAPITRSIFFAGPPQCGKNMLVNAVCTDTGAVKFDISPDTILESDYRDNFPLLEVHLMKIGRLLQPSIFYVNQAHRPFVDKDASTSPSEIDEFPPQKSPENIADATFLNAFLARLTNQISKNDLILMIGVSSEPHKAEMKSVDAVFDRILVFPRVDYDTARSYLFEKIMEYQKVDRDFNGHVLAEACTGMPIPDILKMIRKVMKPARILKLISVPLSYKDFMDILTKKKRRIVSETQEELIFDWYASSKLGKMRIPALDAWKANMAIVRLTDPPKHANTPSTNFM